MRKSALFDESSLLHGIPNAPASPPIYQDYRHPATPRWGGIDRLAPSDDFVMAG